MNTIASVTLPIMYTLHATIASSCNHVSFIWLWSLSPRTSGVTDRSCAECQGGDWGICEISLFSGDQLMSSSAHRTIYIPCWRKVRTAISDNCRCRSRMPECKTGFLSGIIEKFCEPQVAIVSLTITEKAIVLTRPPVHSTPAIRGLFRSSKS